MNIVIIGQGAIGLLWYHHLTKFSANSVSLLCSARVTEVPKYYIFTNIDNQRTSAPLNSANDSHLASADIILICLKSYQIQASVEALVPKIAAKATIIFCHNGMGVFRHSTIKQTALVLLTTHGSKIRNPFDVIHTGLGHSDLGLVHGTLEPALTNSITTCLSQALPTLTYSDDIKEKQWLKLAINCVINPLTALENIDNGQLLDKRFEKIIVEILHEVIAVAEHAQVYFELNQLKQLVMQVAKNTAKNCSSMRSDILKKRKTEIDYINGYIVTMAKKSDISTPTNQSLWIKVKKQEQGY